MNSRTARTGRSNPNVQRLVSALTPASSAGISASTPTAYQQRWGLNYDPNYQPITGYQGMSYTDAVNQGYSPAMSEAAARGQGIPQYASAPGPNIDDMDNVTRREAQGDGAGLFAMGMAGMLGAAGLIGAAGGGAGAGATGVGSTAGTGAGAAGTAAGTAGTTAGTAAGGLGAASAIPEGIEGVTVLGSSGAGAGAGAAAGAGAGIGGSAAFWNSVNQGASNTSATNQLNDQQLHDMQAPSTGTDWSSIIKRAARGAGILNNSGVLSGGGGGGARPTPGGGIQRNIPNPVGPTGTPLPTGAPAPLNPALAWSPQTFGGGGGVGFRPTPQQNLQPIAGRPYAALGNAPAGTNGY